MATGLLNTGLARAGACCLLWLVAVDAPLERAQGSWGCCSGRNADVGLLNTAQLMNTELQEVSC